MKTIRAIATFVVLSLTWIAPAIGADADPATSFFLTSAGPGNGADLGGLEGADAHCQRLAGSVGAGGRTWRAYLSTTTGVNARDRIGEGPWYNARGVEIAASVENLHGDNNLTKETQLDEQGRVVNGRGDSPNRHDILTGSNADGTASDATCGNWTSSGDGSAQVGHHDRTGGGPDPTSWNSAHGSRGCSQSNLQGTGGDGLFYCFAID
jgi:hypothetical protein